MSLVTSKHLLLNALKGKYAVGAFNANNLEMIQAIIEAATIEKAPVIVQFSQGAINYAGIFAIKSMVGAMAKYNSIPIVLHFDHGRTVEQNIKCLNSGFTSLMFDGSDLSFTENINQSKILTQIAHFYKIPVELELGKVLYQGVDNNEIINTLTNPYQVKEFIYKTKADSLAVAVGSVHSQCSSETQLDIDRLKEISKEIPEVPLVLHGSSGVDENSIRDAIANGICKVNVGTCLIKRFSESVKNYIQLNPDVIDPRKYLNAGKEEMKDEVRKKIRLFGSSKIIK
ncbi:fructose-bisphosphate aldolase [Tangfeifania diversioriginum]|uniref:Fructose-bisphosphate aldolase n=1 Tax=Tangfeifania diversioriginum TaxID=1168035 RepID=A0A1M6BY12_9BACT|nr:class II fructose-bisphosphate aldolase [Tangfeifania diversioriginum]SHI53679.1 fructose-bisphosphate aldolase [Tangfeifania diversioriginum]